MSASSLTKIESESSLLSYFGSYTSGELSLEATVISRRKTPEEFLREAQAAESDSKQGYLKIFLGYASGVGKSLRMLDEARRRNARGQDVVIGAIQARVTRELETILQNLEVMPLKEIGGGTALDVTAILRRSPAVCVVDGLAYDNPAGSKNRTRWEDVQELVQAGIKVIAAINIQFITELREEVERLTGKHVSETVPISFIRSADEIEIVDAPPVDAGEYPPGEQDRVENRQQKLLRLREMALVLAADVVDQQLTKYLESHGIHQQFGAQERIMVCLTADSNAQEMIRTAQTIAQRFYGELYVVNVDQPEISSVDRAALDQKLAFARSAGARVHILHGRDYVEAVLEFARSRGITQVFIGHSHRSTLWSNMLGNSVDRLVRQSRGMDVRIFPN
jgi:two-component system, OmpR family, sensor histidine kinase KdpD